MKKFKDFIKNDSINITHLRNGLTVLFENKPDEVLYGLSIGIGVGSQNEENSIKGVSHFLEHMLFNGTENKSKEELLKSFEARGTNINAFTNYHMTAMTLKGKKEFILDDLNDSLDILTNCELTEEATEKERQVIIEEYNMYYDDVQFLVYDNLMRETFKNTPYEEFIIGTKDSINNISQNDLREYYDNYYVSDNIIISLTGDFNDDEKNDIIKKLSTFSKKSDSTFEALNENYKVTNLTQPSVNTIHRADIQEQAKVGLMSPIIENINFENDLNFKAAHQILSSGMTSILFEEIREKRSMCYGINSYHSFIGDVGYNTINTSLNRDRIDEFNKTISELWDDLPNLITQDKLNSAKNLLDVSLLSKGNNVLKSSTDNIEQYMQYGKVKTVKERFTLLEKLFTLENVETLLSNIPHIKEWNQIIIKNEN